MANNDWNYNQTQHIKFNYTDGTGYSGASNSYNNGYLQIGCDYTKDEKKKVDKVYKTIITNGVGDKFLNNHGDYTDIPTNYSKDQIEQFSRMEVERWFKTNEVDYITTGEKDKLRNLDVTVNNLIAEAMKDLPSGGTGTGTISECKCERRFKPKLYATMYGCYNLNDTKKYFDFAKEYLDGVFIHVEIMPPMKANATSPWEIDSNRKSDFENYRTLPNFEQLQAIADYCKEIGLDVVGLKFHNDFLRDNFIRNVSTMTEEGWILPYENLGMAVVDIFKDFRALKYITFMNETEFWNADGTDKLTDRQKGIINIAINNLKDRGYKVGICGNGILGQRHGYEQNLITTHQYQNCGYKEEFTTANDCINAWQTSNFARSFRNDLNNFKNQYPDLEYGMTETGVQSIWKKLSIPENYDLDGYTVEPNGKPVAKYLTGFLEANKEGDVYDFAVLWYVSDWTGRYCESREIKRVLKYYLGR